MNDMSKAIIPKSDQLNADDLIAGPMTIKITEVTIRGGQEQPVSIHFEGDNGKPWKPCKSMSRVLVANWGADAKKYIGRSLSLYREPTVKWAGMEVGGIRISHMSDIDSAMTMALTATKGSRKPFTVKPLVTQPAPRSNLTSPSPSPPIEATESAGAGHVVECLTFEQAMTLAELLEEKLIPTARLLAAAEQVTGDVYLKLDQLPADFYERATVWIDKQKSNVPDKKGA